MTPEPVVRGDGPVPFVATYRLQIRPEFDLAAATAVIPYLASLGISHVYTSPLLQARSGSQHGYDVVDPSRMNRELGSEADRLAFLGALRGRGLGWMLDIVPNHLAIGPENRAWEDVLTHGPSSLAAAWFDVEWDAPGRWPEGGILLPVLADQRHRCLARGEIRLVVADAGFRVTYGNQSFPVEPASIALVLADETSVPQLVSLRERFAALPRWTTRDLERAARRRSEAAAALAELASLLASDPGARRSVERAVAAFDGPTGRARWTALLERQPYRLVHWRRAARELNYRRFFEVTELVGVRVEDPAVFTAVHAAVLGWVRDGGIDALRIDHVDGLLDPLGYLRTLAGQLAQIAPAAPPALYVEKILADRERLPAEWPVAGTTGYDFLAAVDALFVDPAGLATIEAAYRRRVAARSVDPATIRFEAKRRILRTSLGAETARLARQLAGLAKARPGPGPGPLAAPALRLALVEVIAALPVYRTYVDQRYPAISPADREVLSESLAEARRRGRAPKAALDALASVLLPDEAANDGSALAARRFVQRFQQVSGPAMAKGVEDTAFYSWAPLASRNEVGADPGVPPLDALPRFHQASEDGLARHPARLLCTTTHDTKRSADLRARLHVLSEIPAEWLAAVERWRRRNAGKRTRLGVRWSPDRPTEYGLYQTLVGIWPFPDRGGVVPAPAIAAIQARVRDFTRKAIREAKVRTSWTEPDLAFEEGVARFVDGVFADAGFLEEVAALAARIARPGLWTALARTLLHLTVPGVPDLYQGDELWRFSLVDPDSRRPVDFGRRVVALAGLASLDSAPPDERASRVRELVDAAEDGRIKLHLVRTVLATRHRHLATFARGAYRRLDVAGERAAPLGAFARLTPPVGGTAAIRGAVIVAPRLVANLPGAPAAAPLGPDAWGDTRIEWPWPGAHGVEAVTGASIVLERDDDGHPSLRAADALAHCPAALVLAPA